MTHEFAVSEYTRTALETQNKLPGLLADFPKAMQAACGLAQVTYYAPKGHGQSDILMTTYSDDWISRYFDKGYAAIDPVLLESGRSVGPVDWMAVAESARDLFGEAAEFGIPTTGVTIPVQGLRGETACFSVNFDVAEAEWSGCLEDHITDLICSAHLLHNAVCNMAKHDETTLDIRLSKREKSVLEWAACGKTAWETAQILSLKEKTISFYLGNACEKLGVTNKTHAVAMSLERSLISLDHTMCRDAGGLSTETCAP